MMMRTGVALGVLFAAGMALALNPIIQEGEFLSDPAPRVGPDGALWLFGSRDEDVKRYCSYANDVLETRDLVNWIRHPGILISKGEGDAVPASDEQLYAPDAIFHNGQWALFYCMPDRAHREGVAFAERPTGPFAGARGLAGCDQIDPSVFRDDDGTLYYFWGQFALRGGILKADLSGLEPGSVRTGIIDEARHNFHEGVQLTKRNGIYYLVFADIGRRRRPTCIGYATSDKPFGPYVYRGVIVDNYGCDPQSWNNHGGIVEYKGRWYVVYHRSTNGSNTMRKACVEPIAFDADGFIAEVETTSNGAGPELDPFVSTPARIACVMSGNVRIVTLPDRHERLGNIRAGDTATWRYFNVSHDVKRVALRVVSKRGGVIEMRDVTGASYGRVAVPAGDGQSVTEAELTLTRTFPTGRRAVAFAFHGRPNEDLFDLESWRFLGKRE